jgi:hypothetical protein
MSATLLFPFLPLRLYPTAPPTSQQLDGTRVCCAAINVNADARGLPRTEEHGDGCSSAFGYQRRQGYFFRDWGRLMRRCSEFFQRLSGCLEDGASGPDIALRRRRPHVRIVSSAPCSDLHVGLAHAWRTSFRAIADFEALGRRITFPIRPDFVTQTRPRHETGVARLLYRRDVDEQIPAAVIG